MLHFHYCKAYLNSVSTQVKEAVEKTLNEYSNRDSLKGIGKISSFTGGVYVLEIRNPHAEIILEEKQVTIKGNVFTVYFIRALKKNKGVRAVADYTQIRDGKWLIYNSLPEFEMENAIQNFDEQKEMEETKESPPKELLTWQNEYGLKVEYDIYETREWVKFACSNSGEDGMKADEAKLYRLVLLEILKPNNKSEQINHSNIYSLVLNDIGIIYCKIEKKHTIYLLLNGANIKTQAKHWENLLSKERESNFSEENIIRISLKAYPSWVLNNADLWAKIEKNNEMGNLSLLPEQTDFLTKFTFPKYINGQAGSGKSTMLYYLFANAYYYKYADVIKGDIIFLTENERLLEHTKQSVYDLLLLNPEFDLSSDDIAITNVEKHFSGFKEFLLTLLPDEDRKLFDNQNNEDSEQEDYYLNFPKFKDLYEGSKVPNYIKNKYSAELVWFIISTYVYGYDLEYQITNENYEEKMPKEGKELVSLDELKEIEKHIIYPFYDKLVNREDRYWDKIKLIKYLNKNVRIQNRYEVIFCDEAQDFSRVELNFILKLSVYSQYDLSNVKQFPIVFAGDALQTVNPTGFKAEVLTAMLHNELTSLGYKIDSQKLEFTPTYNYRSSQTIVNVANAIQYRRKEELNAEISFPQESKRPVFFENEHLNVFVTIEDFNTNEVLQQKLEYKTIIVPVNQNQIEDYKKQYPVLSKYNNIISAVDAKGIDFNEVAIFGFGEWHNSRDLGLYEKQFFFNKLYVAATRAREELVIIDSQDSKDIFWKDIINKYINSTWKKETSISKFEDIVIFDANEVIQSASRVVEEDAKRQMERGIVEENTALLQVASCHFFKIGKMKEYYLCLAEEQKIKGNWVKSASYYLKKEVGEEGIENAAIVYWQGKYWNELLHLNGSLRNERQQVRVIIAKLFVERSLVYGDLKLLYEKIEILKYILNQTFWRKEVVEVLLYLLLDNGDTNELRILSDILENICDENDSEGWRILGEKYFELQRYDAAISALEKSKDNGEIYLKANLEVAKRKNNVPEIIIWLGRLSELPNQNYQVSFNEIIHFYSQNKQSFSSSNEEYSYLYSYIAYLITEPYSEELIRLSKEVENLFQERRDELTDRYYWVLQMYSIPSEVSNFIIERWAKNYSLAGGKLSEFNQEYEKIASEKGFLFKPFEENEIATISIVPTNILNIFPEHISNVTIRNFRQFKDVNIQDLGLFNLVVGDNNIGKTSLLEALLFTPNKKEYLERLAFAYIERTNIHPDKDRKDSSANTLLYYTLNKEFLNDFETCQEVNENISFTFIQKRNIWNYELDFNESQSKASNHELRFQEDDYNFLAQIPYLNAIKQPFMPYGKGFSSDLAHIYDSLIRPNRKLESEFKKNMKLFIPQITQIYASLDGSIDIRDEAYPEDRPLHQYGEGANKLFRILILLGLHKGKRLLIDEIDAGIHYTKFKLFWNLILTIAKRDNTQIIATTHNEECILYCAEELDKLGEKYQNEMRLVQIKMVNELKIRSYKFEDVKMSLNQNIDVRGGRRI